MTRWRADALLIFAAAVWGVAFIFQKSAMATLGPFTFIAARSLVATIALIPVVYIEWRLAQRKPGGSAASLFPPPVLQAIPAAGAAFTVAAALQQYGLTTATATNAGFLTALYVVLTPALAWLLRGTVPKSGAATGRRALGGRNSGAWRWLASRLFRRRHVSRILCGVLGAARDLDESGAAFDRPALFTCGEFLVVAVLSTTTAVMVEHPSLASLAKTWAEIAYVGIVSSAITFSLLTFALKYTPSSEAMVIVSTESLFAAAAGAWLLGERLPPRAWVGAALIMAAVVLVQLSPRRAAAEAD